MAGAGYKLFNTGDVLTAAQVNTYLMEQTMMVFADSSARTTALSGVLAEGMLSYLQNTNAVEVYDGSSWVGVSSDKNLIINAQTGTTYTFVLTDNGKLVTSNNGSAQTLSIPTNASVAYPTGAQINVAWITGAGQPTINAVTPGTTTILSTGASSTAPKLRVVNSVATCIKIATDTWLVTGDIS